jgi:hypothetical protein
MIAMVMGALALMGSALISNVGAAPPPDKVEPLKVFVCKYTGKPGVDEVLQTGSNPISVSVNAIKNYAGIGSYFNDGQDRSYVLAEDTRTGGGQEGEPSVTLCPVPSTTTTTEETTTTTEETTTTTEVDETTTTTEVEETTTTTEATTTTTTEPEVTTTTTEPEVEGTTTTVAEVTTTVGTTPTTEAPVTLPTVPTTPDTVGVSVVEQPEAAPQDEVMDAQLARTGASDYIPVLTMVGVGLMVAGAILSRKSANI